MFTLTITISQLHDFVSQLNSGPIIGALLGGMSYKMFQHSIVPFACCPKTIEFPNSSNDSSSDSNENTSSSSNSIASVEKLFYKTDRGPSTDSGISETQKRTSGTDQTIYLPIGR